MDICIEMLTKNATYLKMCQPTAEMPWLLTYTSRTTGSAIIPSIALHSGKPVSFCRSTELLAGEQRQEMLYCLDSSSRAK
jgi:hypothetical protein